MNEQYPAPIGPEREEELIRRIEEGSSHAPEKPSLPPSEEVAEEIVVQSFVASQHSLMERIHSELGDDLPKRPNLADRLAADRKLRQHDDPEQHR